MRRKNEKTSERGERRVERRGNKRNINSQVKSINLKWSPPSLPSHMYSVCNTSMASPCLIK